MAFFDALDVCRREGENAPVHHTEAVPLGYFGDAAPSHEQRGSHLV